MGGGGYIPSLVPRPLRGEGRPDTHCACMHVIIVKLTQENWVCTQNIIVSVCVKRSRLLFCGRAVKGKKSGIES